MSDKSPMHSPTGGLVFQKSASPAQRPMRDQVAHSAQYRGDVAFSEHPCQVAVVEPFPSDVKGQEFGACLHLSLRQETRVLVDANGGRLPRDPVKIPNASWS